MSVHSLEQLFSLEKQFLAARTFEEAEIDNSKPIFKANVKHFYELRENMVLRGRVVNVTPFGTFIDVGLDNKHTAYLRPPPNDANLTRLVAGQLVVVQVVHIDASREKFRVRLKKILNEQMCTF
ncbi:s1 rna-binding domain-containing protein 1-like protein [Dinothrombium tinctorium]|uniref:S1 rna-binding domain-containing protein 1-like protein n=1 Tax=Dinothrombium tinctorium TaxID=1965070 RepID=A0A3S3P282_9ACAR|nr:s1 rna-binding domain-containing protein 1-like protein [Dinothrombium tinctorium]RWS06109.1 s1 rna-binding domain-containing protein 1-like protein [Dinothrombium tinctorium]